MKTTIAVIMICLPIVSLALPTEPTCWTTKGEQIKLAVEDFILKIPDSIAAIDLCGVAGVTLDCSSACPNCLFYTDRTTVVEGLPNANVVCDGVCEGLLLTDDACFYCPMAFFATDAMLRFTPKRDDDNEDADFSQPCHETVVLPFDTDFVIPADINGPMPEDWLQAAIYIGFDNNMLVFKQTYAGCLNANKPYLVTFTYGAYGTKILFCGQNKNVEVTKTTIENEELYSFTGITMSKDEEPNYFRYHRGQENYFIHTGDGMPMEPFRCFIVSPGLNPDNQQPSEGSGQILEYTVFDEAATGIDSLKDTDSSKKYYDLLGRPIANYQSGKGIRITRGVKIVK